MADFEKNKQESSKINNPIDKKQSPQVEKDSGQNDKSTNDIAAKISSAVQGDTKAAKDIYSQAKDSAGKAYGIATEKAASKIDEQKTSLAQGLSSVADNIRQLGDNLRGAEKPHGIAEATANYSSTVADKVEQLSGYLDRKDLGEVMDDVEDFAHRNPLLFLGGAFALGILAARFLKSSNPNQALMRRPQNSRRGIYSTEGLDKQIKPKSSKSDLTTDTSSTGDNLSARVAK